MNKIEDLEDGWKSFEKIALPANCHPIQKTESRRAFHAGVAWLLSQVSVIGDGEDYTEDEAVAHLEKVANDIQAFVKKVGNIPGY